MPGNTSERLKILIVTVSLSIKYIREETRRALEALDTGDHIVDWIVLTEQLEDSEIYTHSEWTVGKTIRYNSNKARQFALENGYDYMFFIESDVIPPPHALLVLLENEVDIVSGLLAERVSKVGENILSVYMQGLPGIREMVRAGKPFVFEHYQANTGRGCLLVSRRALEHPFQDSDGYYCEVMREKGFKVWVDPRVACSHVDRDGSIMEPVL